MSFGDVLGKKPRPVDPLWPRTSEEMQVALLQNYISSLVAGRSVSGFW